MQNNKHLSGKVYEAPKTTMGGKKEATTPGGKKDEPKSGRGGARGGRPPIRSPPGTPKTPKTPGNEEKTDMQKILEKLGKLDKIDDSITAQESAVTQLTEKLETINSRCDENKEAVNEVKAESAGVKVQVKIHGTRLAEIEWKVELLERERRRNVLIIDGVNEEERENTRAIVSKAFEDLEVNFDAGVCAAIFRRGKKPTGEKAGAADRSRPRPIVVTFQRQQEKGEIFRHLKNLKGKERWDKIFFNDDLTETQTGEQWDLRALAAYAKDLGHDAIVKAGLLYFDGRRYRYDELQKLPEAISLLKAKSLHILEDKAVVFQSPHSPLSNLYPCNLIYQGEGFLSAEGAWQYTRATVCGYLREAQLIKQERRPFKVKSIASAIRNTPEWEDKCEEVMQEILLQKFKQNTFCRDFLLETGERKLFEGTGDRKWGCGIPISKAKQIGFKNPGRNLLGLVLETVRRDLKPK